MKSAIAKKGLRVVGLALALGLCAASGSLAWADEHEARREHAAAYTNALRGVVASTPETAPWAQHAFYVYVVEVPNRDRVRSLLAERGILTGVHYPIPLHLQPACQQYGYALGSLPVTEAAAERILSLPMYAELTDTQIQQVCDALVDVLTPTPAH